MRIKINIAENLLYILVIIAHTLGVIGLVCLGFELAKL